MIVTLNAIGMNNNTPDGNGSLWYVTGLDGWDSPAQRLSSIQVPTKHGEVTVENLYGARSLMIAGVCKATNASTFYTSMYYLQSQTNALITPITFVVTEDIARRLSVIRSAPVRTKHIGVGAFSFEINLKADDPFKYANAADSNSLVAAADEVLVNAGTVITYPTITMTATGTPVITNDAKTWTATGSIPSGTVIDMRAMTVLNGVTSYFDNVSAGSDWFGLEPGNNTVESSVNCTVAWRSSWV